MAASDIQLLFVQTGGATTLTLGTGDTHTLAITGVTAQTLYFSDRPNRIAGATPTATFVDQWTAAFASRPPNATLIGHPEAGGETDEAVVVELMNPTYHVVSATLTYQVHLLDAEEIADRTFEQEPLTVLDSPAGTRRRSSSLTMPAIASRACFRFRAMFVTMSAEDVS